MSARRWERVAHALHARVPAQKQCGAIDKPIGADQKATMTHAHPGWREWAIFAACTAIWSSGFAGVHLALALGVAPPILVPARLWISTAALHLYILWRRRNGVAPTPKTAGQRRKLAIMGVFGAAAPFVLFTYAQTGAPSGLVALYSAFTPLLVATFAPLVTPEDRLTTTRLIGVALGFGGVGALMGPAALNGLASASLLAQVAAMAAATCVAANTLIARGPPPVPAIESSAGYTLYGALITTPFGLMALSTASAPDPAAWLVILYLALFPTAICSIAFFYLIERVGPVFVTQTSYLVPLGALMIGAVAFAEPIGFNAFAAFVLMALGLFVAQEGWRALRRGFT